MKYLCLLVFSLVSSSGYSQNAVSRFSPALSEVTVYFSGAELRHTGEINLPAGQTELRISGVSAFIEAKSLQVEISNNAELLSANLVSVPAPKGVSVLSDSLTQLETELRT